MITSIRLVNWRSHKDTALDFSRGTNLLVGIMGGGKSSVLEGISFALFGTFPALERRRIKLDDVVRFNEERASVVLEMKWNGQDYKVERTIARKEKRTATKAEIFRDGSLIDSGPKAVTSYVEQLLGVDYDLFTRAIYSEQNNIDYFLNLDPRRRKEEIDKLLGLDKFEVARGNIVSVINRTVSNRKILEEKFDKSEMEQTLKTLEHYRKEITELEEKSKKTKEEYEKKAKETADLEKRFEDLRKMKQKYESLEKELTRIKGMIETIKPEIKEKVTEEEYEKLKEKLADINKELEESKKKKDEFESKRSSISKETGSLDARLKTETERKERIEKLKKTLESLLEGKKLTDYQAELKEKENEILKLNSERKSMENEIKETKELFEKLKPGMANCPLCESALDEKGIDHIKKEKKEIIERNEGRIKKIDSEMPKARKDVETLKDRIKKIDFADDRISSLEKEAEDVDKLKAKKKTLEEELSEVLKKIELNEEKVVEKQKKSREVMLSVEKFGQIIEKRRKLALLEEKEKELLKDKETVKYDEKSFEESRSKLEDSRINRQKLESDKTALENQLKTVKETKTMLEKRMDEMKGMEKKMEELSKLSEELKIFKNALLDAQVTLRKNLIEAINAAMNEIWEIFYPYKNYTTIKLGVTEKDYVFEVYERGAWKSLETVASGGERACAALTLRVALATVLTPNLSWLILDEPTHNLDKETVGLLSETLQLKVPQVVNQTFVITHEEGLIGADFATSYKLTRIKETDGPTEIENI